MPTFWRYLLKKVISIFSLSILSFIVILLITRIHSIAKFAILSPSPKAVATFIGCQIPYILPIVIPLSALISTFITMRKLSTQHEVTAFRALGISLRSLISPLILLGLFFSAFNFMLTSELTPRARQLGQKLLFSSTIKNPLFLLQNSASLGLEKSIIEMQTENGGKSAKDVIFARYNNQTGHLFFSKADRLDLEDSELKGSNMVIITHGNAPSNEPFDHLFIENQKSILFSADFLCNLLESKPFNDEPKHWPLGDLSTYIRKGDTRDGTYLKVIFEVKRRVFYAIITFLLTWMGAILGITTTRRESKKNIVLAATYTMLTFMFVILAKSFSTHALISSMLFLTPIVLLLIGTLYAEQTIIRGRI